MCLCTHGFIMVHHSRAFSRCMVDYTLMTDQMIMMTFLFSILYTVMYQEAEFATNIQQEGPVVISMKINPNIKQELPKDFKLQLFVMKFVYYLHLTSYLISQ